MDINYKDALRASDERLAELDPQERLQFCKTRDTLKRRINLKSPKRPLTEGEIQHILYHLGSWLNGQDK